MTQKYDVAVVGVGVGANYGSALTYYSITETIKELGKTVILVNKIGGGLTDIEISSKNPSYLFAKKYNILTPYCSKDELEQLNDYADTFVIGTDQVWGNAIASYAGEAFYLGFVADGKRKVSIAGSFGHFDDFTPMDKVERRKELFQRFNALSTRELDGAEILGDKYHVKAEQIIEPVFYIDNEKWFNLAEKSQMNTSEPYLLTYILDNTPEKQAVVDKLSSELGISIRNLPDGFENVVNGKDDDYKYTPEDVLKLLRDAKYIVTDSFHGTSFSLKFNKNFVALVNPRRGVSRFNTLEHITGAKERLVLDYSKVIKNPQNYLKDLDYRDINQNIEQAVNKAKVWIKAALESDINQKVEIFEDKSKETEKKIIGKTYSFGRKDLNTTYSREWRFSENGEIVGYYNENEKYWKAYENKIFVYASDKSLTSIFEIDQDGNVLSGISRYDIFAKFFLIDSSLDESNETEEDKDFFLNTKEYLMNHTFVWYPKSKVETPLSKDVTLLATGRILGMPQSASSKFWELSQDSKTLKFYTENRKINFLLNLNYNGAGELKTTNGLYRGRWEEHILEDRKRFDKQHGSKKIQQSNLASSVRRPIIRPQNDEVTTFLTTRNFDLYKAKTSSPLNVAIDLSQDGTVNNFEGISYWSIDKNELSFYDKQEYKKMSFGIQDFLRNYNFSKFRLVGKYLKEANADYVLYLHPINKKVATPAVLFSRMELIKMIRNNEKIISWEQDLLNITPELEVYVGRELKEYAHNFVGGPADILTFPKSKEEVSKIVTYAHKNNIPITVIGRGSNILVRDGGIRGIVLNMTKLDYRMIDDNVLIAGSGTSLIETSYYLLEKRKSGLEWANNIPGTIGGAVYMNAGANKDIKGMFIEATIVDEKGEIKVLNKNDISFRHRYSSFMEHPEWIIVEAKLQLIDGNPDVMSREMTLTVQNRENKHPLDNPNNGSTFTWWRAARIIQQAGLIGTRIGGVEVSEKFPNFFLNVDQGTAADYEALIYHVISKVYQFSGFLMKPEVVILGSDMWEATIQFGR